MASTTPSRSMNSSAPARKRSCAKSVSGFTITWPRLPCARAMRPTTAIELQSRSGPWSLVRGPWSSVLPLVRRVADFERHRLPFPLAGRRRQRAKRRGGSALLADHLPELARTHVQLDQRRPLVLRFDDAHVVRTI